LVFVIRVYAVRSPADTIRPSVLGDGSSGPTSKRMSGVADEIRKVKVMLLIQVVEVLIVVGVLLWLVNRFIPMQSSIKSILNGVVVIAVVLWLLNVFGLFHSLSNIRVGKG
jgi:hypothetical protein